MAGDMDASAQMRFLATVRRQSAPPRCNPFVIVLQVSTMLSLVNLIFFNFTYNLKFKIQ